MKYIGEWDRDLSWCPTQLTRKVQVGEFTCELYCRWRHQDPFTIQLDVLNPKNHSETIAHISLGSISDCDSDEMIPTVEKTAEDLLAKWVNDNEKDLDNTIKSLIRKHSFHIDQLRKDIKERNWK